MRRLTLLVVLSLLSVTLSAQQRLVVWRGWEAPQLFRAEVPGHGSTPRAASTVGMVGGGLLGGAVGFAAGALIGSAVGGGNALCGDDACGLEEAAWGAAIGESVLLPLGVHLVNHRRGNYGFSLLASAGIAGLGILAVDATNDGWPLIPVPVAQLVSAILIERATAGR